MQQALTIVMYHYVRDLRNSPYPGIKGLSTDDFIGQIQYIKKHYTVISAQILTGAIADQESLPPRPLLLTFDDGYNDHFANVFPLLEREHLPGCFFPPAKCILEHEVLDVNKIHFILASAPEMAELVEYIDAKISENQARFNLLPPSVYRERLAKASRFDPAEVIYCKRILQRELPLALRRIMIDELFERFVTRDEAAFSQELYMSPEQIRDLRSNGMYVGSHGYDHLWLDRLSFHQQQEEIRGSLRFLESVGADTDRWIMCYPHGACNDSLISILKAHNCVAGLTTQIGLAHLDQHDPFMLPRIDTNDLPKDSSAEANEWTRKAVG